MQEESAIIVAILLCWILSFVTPLMIIPSVFLVLYLCVDHDKGPRPKQ